MWRLQAIARLPGVPAATSASENCVNPSRRFFQDFRRTRLAEHRGTREPRRRLSTVPPVRGQDTGRGSLLDPQAAAVSTVRYGGRSVRADSANRHCRLPVRTRPRLGLITCQPHCKLAKSHVRPIEERN